MSVLGRPAVLAGLLSATALVLHPALRCEAWLPGRDLVVTALLLACAIGLLARARASEPAQRRAAWVLALGAGLAIAALGLDGIGGAQGTLRLALGQGRNNFDEIGRAGQPLGLRPFGFALRFDRADAAGGVTLSVSDGDAAVAIREGRAVRVGGLFDGFRLAQPRVGASGGVARLRVSVSDGARSDVVDLAPGVPGRARDLTIALDEFFPDFALDEKQKPFSRSAELRNPAALLTVERAGQSYRAFVIQSMPGVHRIESLGLTFSLLEAEAERQLELSVHREPFAPLVLLGGVLIALGLGLGWLREPIPGPLRQAISGPQPSGTSIEPAATAADHDLLGACALSAAALLLADGRVLAWSFGVPAPAGRAELPGVGVFLGLSLLAACLGGLWLVARALAGGLAPLSVGRGAAWLAVSSGAAGLLLAVVRASVLAETTPAMVRPIAGLALALAFLALALRGRLAALGPGLAFLLALVAPAAGLLGLFRDGSYATPLATAVASTLLLALVGLLPTGFVTLRRCALLLGVLALFVRPA